MEIEYLAKALLETMKLTVDVVENDGKWNKMFNLGMKKMKGS